MGKIRFRKIKPTDRIWYIESEQFEDTDGIILVTFDKKRIYNVYEDYNKMTDEEKKILKEDNPMIAGLFED